VEEYVALLAEIDRTLEERGCANAALARAYILDKFPDLYEALDLVKTINLDTLRGAMEQEEAVAFANGEHGVGEAMIEDMKRRAAAVDMAPVTCGGVHAGRDTR